jgi:hypothetical protein
MLTVEFVTPKQQHERQVRGSAEGTLKAPRNQPVLASYAFSMRALAGSW